MCEPMQKFALLQISLEEKYYTWGENMIQHLAYKKLGCLQIFTCFYPYSEQKNVQVDI